jgi:hypothetical protein
MSEKDKPNDSERDEPVKIDLDPEEALKALLRVDPEDEPVPAETDEEPPQGDPLSSG